MTNCTNNRWAFTPKEWSEMMAERQQEVDEIKQVILDHHGSGPEMAAEIIRLRAELDDVFSMVVGILIDDMASLDDVKEELQEWLTQEPT